MGHWLPKQRHLQGQLGGFADVGTGTGSTKKHPWVILMGVLAPCFKSEERAGRDKMVLTTSPGSTELGDAFGAAQHVVSGPGEAAFQGWLLLVLFPFQISILPYVFSWCQMLGVCVSGDVSLQRNSTLKYKMFPFRDDSQKHVTWALKPTR